MLNNFSLVQEISLKTPMCVIKFFTQNTSSMKVIFHLELQPRKW